MKIILKNSQVLFQKQLTKVLGTMLGLANSPKVVNFNNGTWVDTVSGKGNANIYKIDIPIGCTSLTVTNIGGSDAVGTDGKYSGSGQCALTSSDIVLDGSTSLASVKNGKAEQTYDSTNDCLNIVLPSGTKCVLLYEYFTMQYGNSPDSIQVIYNAD